MRLWSVQPSISFLLVSDSRPAIAGKWPGNVRLLNISVAEMRNKLQHSLPEVRPGEPRLRIKRLKVEGTNSKISDFKPMLGAALARELEGCAFWGYLQEDVLLGDLRSFLTEDILAAYDTISPLASPKYNFGPFMIYRNNPTIASLPFRSTQWRTVAEQRSYLTFDEWWSRTLTDHMPALIDREARAGRLRAFAAATNSRQWICDSMSLQQDGVTPDVRGPMIHDARASFTWLLTKGRPVLWSGQGRASKRFANSGNIKPCLAGACCFPSSPELALVHLHGIKGVPALHGIRASAELMERSARATRIIITHMGILLRAEEEDYFSWFSGLFQGILWVKAVDLSASLVAISSLAVPSHRNGTAAGDALGAAIRALQPCVRAEPTRTTRTACKDSCIRSSGTAVAEHLNDSPFSMSCFLSRGQSSSPA